MGSKFNLTRLSTSLNDTRDRFRALLRETAQSVAVVTVFLPASVTSTPPYHGATLSSFTSIALDPHPLVAFSLRVPSRMASTLNASAKTAPFPSAHFIVNVLSASQPHLADRFSRPDLYPHPFADPSVPHTTSHEGVPILSGSLGALSCRLVGPSLPLHFPESPALDDAPVQKKGEGELSSELFIAKVLRVEPVAVSEDGESGLHTMPLVYHRRRYTTVQDHATPNSFS